MSKLIASPHESDLLSSERSASTLNRRGFLASLGAVGALAGTAALAGCSNGTALQATITTPTVLEVLNFALNLEYLEASFYSYVSTGNGLPSALTGTGAGTATGGAQVNFVNAAVTNVAAQLAADETAHVAFLRATITAIGGTPVSMPNLNLAAMGAVTSDATFLTAARQLETVGVSAYAGSAQFLTSNTTAILYAAQILDTESQHESFLRQLCIALSVASPAVDSADIPPTGTTIFNTGSTTGLYTTRTTSQVLGIVYGQPGVTGINSGGFFPNGFTGDIVLS